MEKPRERYGRFLFDNAYVLGGELLGIVLLIKEELSETCPQKVERVKDVEDMLHKIHRLLGEIDDQVWG